MNHSFARTGLLVPVLTIILTACDVPESGGATDSTVTRQAEPVGAVAAGDALAGRAAVDSPVRRTPLDPLPRQGVADSSRRRVVVDSALRRVVVDSALRRVVVDSSPRRIVVAGVDLTGLGYDKGSATAPVVVVNFSDFGCPFCGTFARETEPALVKEYVETGKVFIKHVPFVMGMFPNGRQAARAAECAGEQGRFWPMHDRLYEQQKEWKRSLAPFSLFQQYARAIGLDAGTFATCYTGDVLHPRTARANAVAERFGVRATPSFVVNGRGVEGALPLPQFRMLLDDALKMPR